MKHVLVVGGAGFIGSHVCMQLAEAGYTPVVYDDLSSGHTWAVKWGPLERGDVRDAARLDEVFRRYKPLAVMQFAAKIEVGESVRNPAKYYDNNVGGTLSLLAAMQRHEVGQLVFSSTAAVYGVPAEIPIREASSFDPLSPYGHSKAMCERMIADFGVAIGLRAICLRYFNAAGAAVEAGIGEAHDPESHLIPLALAAVAGDRPPIALYGDDYPTADGTCVRDYIHVTDLARAHVCALAQLERGAASDAFNVGTGNGYSVREVFDAIARVTGRPVPHSVGPRRPGDPPVLVARADKALSQLDWKASVQSLDAIVDSAWRWHKGRRTLTGAQG